QGARRRPTHDAMDLQLPAEHLRFRNELRAWLAVNLPRPWREELRDPRATETSLIELRRAWQKKLYQAGYLGMDWPEGWGGRRGTEVEKSIGSRPGTASAWCGSRSR